MKLPNPLGLYDMHGNIWEWTRDLGDDYTSGVFVNPSEADSGNCKFVKDTLCVLRGGSFDDPPEFLRSADRGRFEPENRNTNVGFRCVRVPL
jgi:formylglycine-generating enzyme required for sulfatase activity